MTTDLGRLWTSSFIFNTKSCFDSSSEKQTHTSTLSQHSTRVLERYTKYLTLI